MRQPSSMPSAATLAKRAAAKAERDAEKAELVGRLDAAVARMGAAPLPLPAHAPQTVPPQSAQASTPTVVVASVSTVVVAPEPSTPSSSQLLVQPVRGAFTPKRTNVEMLLEAATPGGTLVQETFKRAASTPEGEDADARAKRLAAERARLYRARARLDAKLNPGPLLTEQESDTALSVAALTAALDRAGFHLQAGDIPTQRLQAYEKFVAAGLREVCGSKESLRSGACEYCGRALFARNLRAVPIWRAASVSG